MRAACRLFVGALLLGLGAGGACSSDSGRPANAGTGGTGGTGGAVGLVGCLDTPGTLDRPPNGRLPCELIPPGLRL
jgi:hypothetical protein